MKGRINELSEVFKQIMHPSNLKNLGEIRLPKIHDIKVEFEMAGTADVVVGKHYGVAIKDEGDFICVKFGSNRLTEIGSVPTAERNFSTQKEAFAFVEQIQNQVKGIINHLNLKIHRIEG